MVLMAEYLERQADNIEPFPLLGQMAGVSGQLNDILQDLRSELPWAVNVSLSFDGKLHAHVDVRNLEEMAEVECKFQEFGAGMFYQITRGRVPNHPFLHRVSALVAR